MTIEHLGVLATLASIFFGYVGYRRGQKAEFDRVQKTHRDEGAERGTLQTDIQYIKRRSDDLLLEQKETNKNMTIMGERLTRVEESAKSAHRRIDSVLDSCKEHRKEGMKR